MASSLRPDPLRVLVLGGSSEATALARALADMEGVAATLSLAGRTIAPLDQPLPVRVGGFGGVEGLADWLRDHRIDVLVDATHPFATRISANAVAAADRAACRLLAIGRPAWAPQPGDAWTEVDTVGEAVDALGASPRRGFLTIGRLQLAAFAASDHHHYVVRTIDPVAPGHGLGAATFLLAKGPFAFDDEVGLMRAHRIDVLVTKNSGGVAAQAKLAAARALGIPVVLLRRPTAPDDAIGVDEAVARIRAHAALVRRGV